MTSRSSATPRIAAKDGVPAERAQPVEISVISPVYNEEDNILPFADEVMAVMTALGRPFELIFINDGSRDRSAERL